VTTCVLLAGAHGPVVDRLAGTLAVVGADVVIADDHDVDCRPAGRLTRIGDGHAWAEITEVADRRSSTGDRATAQIAALVDVAALGTGWSDCGDVTAMSEDEWYERAELPVVRTLGRLQAFYRWTGPGIRVFVLVLPAGILAGEARTSAPTAAAHGQLSLLRSAALRWHGTGRRLLALTVEVGGTVEHPPLGTVARPDLAAGHAVAQLLGLEPGLETALSGRLL